jgi:predicted  nucleic acid-binding Zn-ribbon protein
VTDPLLIEISPGELFDRITILEIKNARLTDGRQLRNVRHELTLLEAARDRAFADLADLAAEIGDLRDVNDQLWRIEDDIRACEARQDFGAEFVGFARAVYRLNDRRAAIKRTINERLGSSIVEEKSYPTYSADR